MGSETDEDLKGLSEEVSFPHIGCNQQAYFMQQVAETIGL